MKRPRGIIWLLGIVTVCCESATQPADLNEEVNDVAKEICENLLQRPDFMMYETDFLNAIHYAEVCVAYGASNYAYLSKDSALMDKLLTRYEPVERDSISWQDHHVDGNVYGILPFQFFSYTRDSSYLRHGLYLADNQWSDTLPNGLTNQTRYWVDDVFMVASLQIEAYKATKNELYLDRAAAFTANYIDSLQQKNGLFHHGPDAPVHWGRGNGWMASGMAMTLSTLPEKHSAYKGIRIGYEKMMETLVEYQGENGLWRQVIDLPKAWDETSCSAMFAYAISVGINRGILKGEKYEQAVLKAWKGLKDQVNEKGELMNVCAGTGQSATVDYYLDRPRISGDFHGQAPMLWLINSLLE